MQNPKHPIREAKDSDIEEGYRWSVSVTYHQKLRFNPFGYNDDFQNNTLLPLSAARAFYSSIT
jgi:hypothetical protein